MIQSMPILEFLSVALPRKVIAKERFTFSDGTFIPYGAILGVSGRVVHYDPGESFHPRQPPLP